MIRKLLVLTLGSLMMTSGYGVRLAAQSEQGSTQSKEDTKYARKAKRIISQLGVGPKAEIEIRLRDRSELKGYVSESAEEHFVITNRHTGVAPSVTYAQVEKVKTLTAVKTMIKRDLSSPGRMAKKIAIGSAIGLGVLLLVCVAAGCKN